MIEFDLVDNFYDIIEFNFICMLNFKCYIILYIIFFSTYWIVITLFMKNIKINNNNNEIYFDEINNEIDLNNNNFSYVEEFKNNIENNIFNIIFNGIIFLMQMINIKWNSII